MLDDLRQSVLAANLDLVRSGLVVATFGNASGFDRERGLVVIKPSGVDYERLRAEDLVITDLNGTVVEGKLRPSSDTKTHCALYKAWPDLGGVVHTHSTHATARSQARRDLPCYGTTHADHVDGSVPCAPPLTASEVAGNYEAATGQQILKRFAGLDHKRVPMVLVGGHGPFTWGTSPAKAAYHALILEELCKMALLTLSIDPKAQTLPEHILAKHWERKHGAGAYYGQS